MSVSSITIPVKGTGINQEMVIKALDSIINLKLASYMVKAESRELSIDRKVTLSVKEVNEYSGIGINTIDKMLRSPNCPFVLFVGTKKLVKRKEFEEYIAGRLRI